MRVRALLTAIALSTCLIACVRSGRNNAATDGDTELVGAWRATVQFSSGGFAGIHDLEFMYVFNAGGTMTESSNYDAAPPVPPAYGTWRKIGDHNYLARYEFYITRTPDSTEGSTATTGWLPGGWGLLVDTITLAADGRSFRSRMRYSAFDRSGAPTTGGGDAAGVGKRLGE